MTADEYEDVYMNKCGNAGIQKCANGWTQMQPILCLLGLSSVYILFFVTKSFVIIYKKYQINTIVMYVFINTYSYHS